MINATPQNVWEKLKTGSASGAATMDISLTDVYNVYTHFWIHIYGLVPATNGSYPNLRVSADGTTFDSAAGNYQWVGFFNVAGNNGVGLGSTSDTMITMVGTSTGMTNTSNRFGKIDIYGSNLNSSSAEPMFTFKSDYKNNAGTPAACTVSGNGHRNTGQLTKALRVLMNSGNITGSWILYGCK